MATATEEEEAESGDKNNSLENRDDLEEEIVNDGELEI